MATDKQIEANRRNAQLSTGPKTPEGKAISSQNAFQHGLRSSKIVWAGEDPELLNRIRDGLVTDWQPDGPTEWILIERMAVATHKLNCLEELEEEWEANMNRHQFANNLQTIWRRQASMERSFNTSMHNLVKIQKLRGAKKQSFEANLAAEAESVEIAAQPDPAPAPAPAPAAEPPVQPELTFQPEPSVQLEPPSQLIPAPDPPDDLAPQA